MTAGPAGCPDPGLIAAHAEGRLVGDEAARMDAHLASCPTCYEVFAETIHFALDEEAKGEQGGGRGTVIPFVRRPAFRIAAAIVAAAVVVLAAQSWRTRSGREESVPGRAQTPLAADLAAALGERRVVEPRLTGGFQHARFVVLRSGDAPRGLDAYPPDVLAAVARIRERAEANPTPEALGALGVTYLLSGDVGAAVDALGSATEQAPDDPRLQSDLAAAYLVRARRLDEPADLPKALEAAETAIALEGAPEEAWFNRALALEKLHLAEAARQAWEDYLERDATSGWADEARRHLDERPPERQSSVDKDRTRVRAALEDGSRAVERLAQEAPSLLRDHFEVELLPAWAEAYLVGDPGARVLRDHARLVGEALLQATGDTLFRDTARALGRAPDSGTSTEPSREQALGFRALRDAVRLYDHQEPACPAFREVHRRLEQGGSPYADRARERVVVACLYPAESSAALEELSHIEARARERGYLHLLGRAQWLQGLFLVHRGGLTDSLERYRLAHAAFQAVGDRESEGTASALLAENLSLLGESRRAWGARKAALALLGDVRDPRRRHGILGEAALTCLEEGLPQTGLAFQTAVVRSARRWGNAVATAEALTRRAAMRHALGRAALAAADLNEARRWIPRVADGAFVRRLEAEADYVEGSIDVDRRPEVAAAALEGALAYFARTNPVRVPGVRLALARTCVSRGLDAEAEEQLEAGIRDLELHRASLHDVELQSTFFDQAAPLFDEMVDLQLDGHHDPERALFFLERGRARQLADSLAGPPGLKPTDDGGAWEGLPRPLEPAALQSRLPRGVALVYYSSRDRRLLVWALTREACRFAERPLPAAELRRLAAAYEAAQERRARLPITRELSARLYDELLRPLAPVLGLERVLVLVPDGVVQSVAFASLWDRETGRYLVEDHLVGLAPSGTVFVQATAAAEGWSDPAVSALVVGNPRLDGPSRAALPNLPGAEAEATEISRLYPRSHLLIGGEATKTAFLERLPESEVVHFAGHAVGDGAPWTARLLLASDTPESDSGALYLQELDGRGLPHTRVIVLAACRSAAGPTARLGGSWSLVRPFLAAGVPDVVASLWDVDDAVSRRFFVAFHRALLTERDALVALQQTQIALLRDGDPLLAHPASWAGVVSVGGFDSRRLTLAQEARGQRPWRARRRLPQGPTHAADEVRPASF